MQTKKCPLCRNGELQHKSKKQVINYKGKQLVVFQAGDYCNKCNDGIITGKDVLANDKKISNWKSKIDGFLSSDEIRNIRKKLGLTQADAAKFFGGGPNAFGRYESGQVRQLKSTDNLLRLLNKYPELLKELTQEKTRVA